MEPHDTLGEEQSQSQDTHSQLPLSLEAIDLELEETPKSYTDEELNRKVDNDTYNAQQNFRQDNDVSIKIQQFLKSAIWAQDIVQDGVTASNSVYTKRDLRAMVSRNMRDKEVEAVIVAIVKGAGVGDGGSWEQVVVAREALRKLKMRKVETD
ncbi:MAG: hypothetical protein Q9187_005000 [Circinaria calcarea]